MNLLHMKYAVEVAEQGSINKAAEKLYIGQPNLSRAIKELESALGVTVFDRSVKGMQLTSDGMIFIRYAKTILEKVDAVENIFRNRPVVQQRFSLCAPYASYIAEAFAQFSNAVQENSGAEVLYQEAHVSCVLKALTDEDYKLGIVRYAAKDDLYYKTLFEEKGFDYELITDFCPVLVMNRTSLLAQLSHITEADLKDKIEILHADPVMPTLSSSELKQSDSVVDGARRIYVFERASQFSLLEQNPNTYMWVSPIPQTLLERYGLVQRTSVDNQTVYKDVLIHRKDYALSRLDRVFVSKLCQCRRETFSQLKGDSDH